MGFEAVKAPMWLPGIRKSPIVETDQRIRFRE
jgi:hypothetical protein